MKIGLISFYGAYNVGTRHLHSILTRHGHTVHLIFLKHAFYDDFLAPTPKEREILFSLIKTLKPDILSFSVGPFFLAKMAQEITQGLENWFTGPVIWGGLYPTFMPQECIPFADFICIGEGAEALLELVTRLEESKPVDDIQNLWVKKKNGDIIKNPVRPLKQLLEYAPDFTDKNKYIIQNNRLLPVDPLRLYGFQYYTSTTRGCLFSCSLCIESSIRDIYGNHNPVRRRSVENVISELSAAKEAFPGLRTIAFTDILFPTQAEWVEDFAREYKRRVGLPFLGFFDPRALNDGLLNRLKDAGLSCAGLGVQSASLRLRRTIFNKPGSLEDVRRGMIECNKHKIIPKLLFIVDNPYETYEDELETLAFLNTLPKPFEIDLCSLFYIPKIDLTDSDLSAGFAFSEGVRKIYQQVSELPIATINSKRRRKEEVFICLMLLISKKYIPASAAKFLMGSRYSARFPLFYFLTGLTKFLNLVYLAKKFLVYSRKKPGFSDIKRAFAYARCALQVVR
jgi:radical SAM superfamily enzyme YgiQ (UPF0313 family)